MDDRQTKTNLTLGFLRNAYDDYIAARVLLNKNYTLQGVILASTAIEKYFKAAIHMYAGQMLKIHIDQFDKIEKAVTDMGYKVIIDKIDRRFIEILSKAYHLRYYDNIKSPVSIGFFKNQFLGELDYAIGFFENVFNMNRSGTHEQVLSPLKMDIKNKNPDLLENNFLNSPRPDKKSFMETNCISFAVYIHPNYLFDEIHVSSQPLTVEYNGQMTLIHVKPDIEF